MSLFDDRAIEAADQLLRDYYRSGGNLPSTFAILNAALAALPREELIEKAARAIADMRFEYTEPTPAERLTARVLLVAIGLIPEHVTPEEER